MSEPKIVAECWTCSTTNHWIAQGRDVIVQAYLTQVQADKCRAAGHDVRPVEVGALRLTASAIKEELREVERLCPGAHNDDGTCEWCNAAQSLANGLLARAGLKPMSSAICEEVKREG